MNRIDYEKRVAGIMIAIYCRRFHGSKSPQLCEECAALLAYASVRLEHCPKGSAKRSCRICSTHCYSPAMRARIREVMRYAGPRMALSHPVMALRHLACEMSLFR